MAILISVLLVLGACYSPDLPDCPACRDDAGLGDDARVDAATAGDAVAVPDGPQLGVLEVRIEDKGEVAVSGAGSCDDMAPDHTCMFGVVLGVVVTLHATADPDRTFVMWSEGCTGTDPTCMLTPTAAITHVTAKFHKDD